VIVAVAVLAIALVIESIVTAAVGPTTFAALAWGSVALVLGVFGYEIHAVVQEIREAR
jgi:predicted membrane channel-forming protein YqfA (hemolysin III family)